MDGIIKVFKIIIYTEENKFYAAVICKPLLGRDIAVKMSAYFIVNASDQQAECDTK